MIASKPCPSSGGGAKQRTRVKGQKLNSASTIPGHRSRCGGKVSVLSSENDASTVAHVSFTYNGLGDQATQTYRSALTGGSGSVNYSYSFNAAAGGANHSRLTSMTFAGGKVVTYDYGALGSLNEKISRVGVIKEGSTTLEGYSYLGLGTIVERDRPQPGTKLTYFQSGGSGDGGDAYVGLDRFGRVVDQRWVKGATDIDRFLYTYDRNSNRLTKDVTATGAPTDLDEAYFYDGLDRLTRVNRGTLVSGTISDANATYTQTWTLDGLGNWSGFVTDSNGGAPGGTITTRTKTHNRRNRITSISGQFTPTYDANGNMTGDEAGRTFKYDAWDRLVAEGVGLENVRYIYDGRGYRVERIVNGVSTYYHYTEDWQLIEERLLGSGVGPTIAAYVWGMGYVDSMVLRDDYLTQARHYAQQDANYNVMSLTDRSGTVQERYVYDPYGTVTYKTGTWGVRGSSAYGWVYLHQGGRLDSATGLYYFQRRHYSAMLGRWLSTDPIGYADGMNLYQAYGSGPVTFVDPTGLEQWSGRGPEYGWKWDLPSDPLPSYPESPSDEVAQMLALAHNWNKNQPNYVPFFNDCEEQSIDLLQFLQGKSWDFWDFTPVEVWDGLLYHNVVVITPRPMSGNTDPPIVIDGFHGPIADLLGDRSVECYTLADLASDYPWYTPNHSYPAPPGTTPPTGGPTYRPTLPPWPESGAETWR